MRVMLWDEATILEIIRSINYYYVEQKLFRTFDVAEYFDAVWFPGRGLFLEWLGDYVFTETDDTLVRMERVCECAMREAIRNPKAFFHTGDREKARKLAVEFLLEKNAPIKEDALCMHAVGACIDLGCQDYEGAFVNAQAHHVCRFLGCHDCIKAIESGGAQDDKDFLVALYDAVSLQARILAHMLMKRLVH